jgi:hypothetical protein
MMSRCCFDRAFSKMTFPDAKPAIKIGEQSPFHVVAAQGYLKSSDSDLPRYAWLDEGRTTGRWGWLGLTAATLRWPTFLAGLGTGIAYIVKASEQQESHPEQVAGSLTGMGIAWGAGTLGMLLSYGIEEWAVEKEIQAQIAHRTTKVVQTLQHRPEVQTILVLTQPFSVSRIAERLINLHGGRKVEWVVRDGLNVERQLIEP